MAVQFVPPQTQTLVTGEQLLAMGDIGPCELIEGRVVMLSPTGVEHGGYEVNFAEALKGFVRRQKLGKVVSGEVGVYIRRNPDTVRGADVAFISNERYAQRKVKGGYLDVAPELVAEAARILLDWRQVGLGGRPCRPNCIRLSVIDECARAHGG